MNICFVVHTFDARDRGGVLRAVSELANYLVKDFPVRILSFGIVKEFAYHLDNRIDLVSLNIEKYNTSFYTSFYKLNWFKEAYNKVKPYLSVDTIWMTSSPPISLLFSFVKIMNKNIKIIGCDHTSTIYKKNILVQKMRNILLSKLDIMIALTPQDQDYYLLNGINSVCIPNSINISAIKKINNKRKYLIYVGRLNAEKQPFKAIEFYVSSDLMKKNIKMKIYGHGDYEKEIVLYIKEKKYENFIELVKGEIDPDIIYKDAFALILTSKVEGFGLVLLEAMSRNIPCLSFKTQYGPINIINEGVNGYFIENDIFDFSNKLKKLDDINVDEIFLSIMCFNTDVIIKQWEKLILDFHEK